MLVIRHAARSTTIDHPMPMSSRLPPVMFAERERRELLGVLAGLVGEREVDRVLGEHRDQGQHGEGEALRHVELERLRGPGQEERRAEDGEAEHDRRHHVAQAGAADAGQRPRAR